VSFYLNFFPEESLKKILNVKKESSNRISFFIGVILFFSVFFVIRLYYGKVFTNSGFLYLYIPFFIIKSLVLSFGNLFFFTGIYYLTGKLFSGKAGFKKLYFCVSVSAVPIIIFLFTFIPEMFFMKEDLFNLIPGKSYGLILTFFHIILYIIRVFLVLLSIYITIISLKIAQKYTKQKAVFNYFVSVLVPVFIFILLFLYIQNILIKLN